MCFNFLKVNHPALESHTDFSITQNLREINFGNCRSEKSALLTHLVALNCDFYEFLHFLRLKFTKSTKFTASKFAKTAVFAFNNQQN